MRRDPCNDCFVNEKYDPFFSHHFPTMNIIPFVAVVRVWTALSSSRDLVYSIYQPCRSLMLHYMPLPTRTSESCGLAARLAYNGQAC